MSKTQKNILIIVLVILFFVAVYFIVMTIKKKISANTVYTAATDPTGTKGGLNNPGNIRASSIQWKGKITKPGQIFESFATPKDGILALYDNLQAYKNVHGLNTVRQIINRWAPPTDGNNTGSYINYVANLLGVSPDDQLTDDSYPLMVQAISHQEGNMPVDIDTINNALA